MNLCIRVVDITPEDVIFISMQRMDPHWFVARLTYLREVYAVTKDDDPDTIDLIVWCNREVVRIETVDITHQEEDYVCIRCSYKFFIDYLVFDDYHDIENCKNIMRHMIEQQEDDEA